MALLVVLGGSKIAIHYPARYISSRLVKRREFGLCDPHSSFLHRFFVIHRAYHREENRGLSGIGAGLRNSRKDGEPDRE
jgi:hypothetical protein